MAPEVVLGKPYDSSCDVFSFGILLHEILSLQNAFILFSPPDYKQKVVQGGLRPSVANLPSQVGIRHLVVSCWSADPTARPTMADVKQRLDNQLQVLQDHGPEELPSAFLNRTMHLKQISHRSFRLRDKR